MARIMPVLAVAATVPAFASEVPSELLVCRGFHDLSVEGSNKVKRVK